MNEKHEGTTKPIRNAGKVLILEFIALYEIRLHLSLDFKTPNMVYKLSA